jgi:hypothetical protein
MASAQSAPKVNVGKCLPLGYAIGDNDVYCGRGGMCVHHVGNIRFHKLVSDNIDRYCNVTKKDKTKIIYEIVDQIRANSPDGGFVKQDSRSGRWYEVGDMIAVSSQNK